MGQIIPYNQNDYKGLFNIKTMERVYIKRALSICKTHKEAAGRLGISRKTLYNKAQKHSIKLINS